MLEGYNWVFHFYGIAATALSGTALRGRARTGWGTSLWITRRRSIGESASFVFGDEGRPVAADGGGFEIIDGLERLGHPLQQVVERLDLTARWNIGDPGNAIRILRECVSSEQVEGTELRGRTKFLIDPDVRKMTTDGKGGFFAVGKPARR